MLSKETNLDTFWAAGPEPLGSRYTMLQASASAFKKIGEVKLSQTFRAAYQARG